MNSRYVRCDRDFHDFGAIAEDNRRLVIFSLEYKQFSMTEIDLIDQVVSGVITYHQSNGYFTAGIVALNLYRSLIFLAKYTGEVMRSDLGLSWNIDGQDYRYQRIQDSSGKIPQAKMIARGPYQSSGDSSGICDVIALLENDDLVAVSGTLIPITRIASEVDLIYPDGYFIRKNELYRLEIVGNVQKYSYRWSRIALLPDGIGHPDFVNSSYLCYHRSQEYIQAVAGMPRGLVIDQPLSAEGVVTIVDDLKLLKSGLLCDMATPVQNSNIYYRGVAAVTKIVDSMVFGTAGSTAVLIRTVDGQIHYLVKSNGITYDYDLNHHSEKIRLLPDEPSSLSYEEAITWRNVR